MASPEPRNSARGKWTFVNRQGEEEVVEDDTSSTSSASSAEFVKVDGEEVSYHQKAYNTTDVSSPNGDKTCEPVSNIPHHTDLGSCGETGVSEVRQGNLGAIIFPASSMEDASTAPGYVSELCSSANLSLSEEESDVEILTKEPNQEAAGSGSEEICSEDIKHGEVRSGGLLLQPLQMSQPASHVSAPLCEDLPQFRLVLVPSSFSFTDSDSDFSNLDSHPSSEVSESEELSHPTDVNSCPPVHPGCCFGDHGYVADTEERQGPLRTLQDDEDGGQEDSGRINPHLNSAPDTGQDDISNDTDRGEHNGGGNHNEAGVNEEVGNDGFQVIDDNGNDVADPIEDDSINHEIADDADTGTESGVEDDRIESDQSDGLPADEDEDDLSFSNIGLENLSLHEVNYTRHYIHQPNKYLSGTLSLVVIMAGWMALGLGIGHLLGSSKQKANHSLNQVSDAHINELHQTQDNLFLCLHKKGDILNTLRRERREWDSLETELTSMWEASGEAISQLSNEVKNWKIKVNELQQAKVDLESEIVRLRYQKHPGNREINTDRAELAGDEEVKDKRDVLRSKGYAPETLTNQEKLSSIPKATKEWENETAKLKQDLFLAQGRAAMWQQLYLTERNRKPPMVTTPDVFSCLMMLTPRINFSDVVQTLNNSVVKNFMEFPNISLVKSYLNDSFESKRIFSKITEFQALFKELSKLWIKWSSPQTGSDFEKKAKRERNIYESKWKKEESEHQQHTWVENIRQFLNETQKSVAEVSHEIEKKWKRMKDLSRDLWKKHQPAFSKWQKKLSHRISYIGEKIREKLEKKSRAWFKRRTTHHKGTKHNPSNKNDQQHRKRQKGKTHKNGSSEKQDKRLIRNQRRVLQKAFKMLVKKIKRLNMKSYTRQGINGVGRMVAEINTFRVTHGHSYQNNPRMELWINCQLKWWESKVLMEKFAYSDCGKALFKWQIKVEKMDGKRRKEEMWRKTNQKGFSKRCRNKGTGCDKGWQHKRDKNVPRHGEWREDHNDRGFEGRKRQRDQEEHLKRQYTDKKSEHTGKKQGAPTRNVTEGNYLTKSSSWYFKQKRHKMHGVEDSWYVRKMQHQKKLRERESPDGSWMFRRADDRDFHRKRPDDWYFRRSERGRRKTVYRDNLGESFYGTNYDTGESYEYYNGYGFTICY
ncbi:uncharacterized protein LOC135473373 [Liolophura sinensis]|uniref:uncharacterized protein LOC135473373 n=1 Tax=Liolophura sinensis TaxID=3198878 RepID=UPI0031596024